MEMVIDQHPVCRKRRMRLVWGFLECLCFTGLASGWAILSSTFQEHGYFEEFCFNSTATNATDHTSTTNRSSSSSLMSSWIESLEDECAVLHQTELTIGELSDMAIIEEVGLFQELPKGYFSDGSRPDAPKSSHKVTDNNSLSKVIEHKEGSGSNSSSSVIQCCSRQMAILEWVYVVTMATSGLLMLPMGAIYDVMGTLRLRLIALFVFTAATLMVTFSTPDNSWLLFPAWTGLGLSGMILLLTNLQLANLTPHWRTTAMLFFYTAQQCSPLLAFLIQLTAQAINVQTSFMFLTIGVVPILVGTLAFMPRWRLQWPRSESHAGLCEDGENDTLFSIAKGNTPKSTSGDLSALQIVTSPLYVSQTAWLTSLRSVLVLLDYSASMRAQDDHHILGIEERLFPQLMRPAALLVCPMLGLVLVRHDKQRSAYQRRVCVMRGFFAVLCIQWGGTALLSALTFLPVRELLYTSVVLGSVCHVMLLGTNAAVIATLFPYKHFGKSFGLATAVSEVVAYGCVTMWRLLPFYTYRQIVLRATCAVIVLLSSCHLAIFWIHQDSHMFVTQRLVPPCGEENTTSRMSRRDRVSSLNSAQMEESEI